MKKHLKVGFVVYDDYRTNHSGVATFARSMCRLEDRSDLDFRVVEVPDASKPRVRAAAEGHAPAENATPTAQPDRPRRSGSARLALGYVRLLMSDVRLVWRRRKNLWGRVIVTNQFGCETLPVALRIVFPFNRIAAIAHTHPGTGDYGGHPVRRWVERLCGLCVSGLVFNSEAVKEEWRRKLGRRLPDGPVIYYGLQEADTAVPADYPPKPDGCIDFVCVARFVRWKGHRELLNAWRKVIKSEGPGAGMRLVLVGDGPTFNESIEYARRLGLNVLFKTEAESSQSFPSNRHACHAVVPSSGALRARNVSGRRRADKSSCLFSSPDNRPDDKSSCLFSPDQTAGTVFFLGARPNAARYFNGGDVGIQLSIEPEAFGQVFVEAAQRFRPVITTRIGGIPEAAEEGVTGILVPPGDTVAAAVAMRRLAASGELRRKMGRAGRKRWRERFHEDRMLDDYVEYLEQAYG